MVVNRMINRYEAQINKALISILETIQPQRVYLFGSYADGSADEHSDIDLCIVSKTLPDRKLNTLRKIRRAMAVDVDIPVDLLVYTEREFEDRCRLTSTLEYKISNEGVLLHES
jgi:predicted nucleotidyltransferase